MRGAAVRPRRRSGGGGEERGGHHARDRVRVSSRLSCHPGQRGLSRNHFHTPQSPKRHRGVGVALSYKKPAIMQIPGKHA